MTASLPRARPDAISATGDCTALRVRRLARRVTRIYDEALAPHGLTIGQMGTLAHLRRARPIGVAALAERLSNDASTLSRLLRPLIAAGLVSVEPDPADRRAKALRLTDAGADKVREAAPGWHAAQRRLGELLGEERLGALRFIVDDAFSQLQPANGAA